MKRTGRSTFLTERTDVESVYRIFIHALEISWTGGPDGGERVLYADIELIAERPRPIDADRYRKVACYDRVVKAAKAIAAMPEIANLDTLSDRIAARCLDDERVRSVRVRLRPADAKETGDGGYVAVLERSARAA